MVAPASVCMSGILLGEAAEGGGLLRRRRRRLLLQHGDAAHFSQKKEKTTTHGTVSSKKNILEAVLVPSEAAEEQQAPSFLHDRWWNTLLHRSRATLLFMQWKKLHKSYSRVAMLRLDK